MSPRKSFTQVATATLAVFGIVAVAAGFAIGMTGWPPSRATAAPIPVVAELGVDGDTAVTLASEVDPEDKFESAAATAAIAAAPVAKKLSKPAKKKLTKRPRATARLAATKAIGGGWRAARASWYGPGFYGRTMAGGGRLTRSSMVVAHRSLPFGTRLQISYRGRMVTAVVQDRGPFIAGRTFDLGPGTAKALGFGGVGTIKYRVAKR